MNQGKMNWANLFDYQVQPSDMELFQTYVNQNSQQALLAQRSAGLLFGGRISIIAGLQIQISAGVVLMPDGTLVSFPTTTAVLTAADPSNPRIDRIELAYVIQNNTNVVDVNSQAKVLDMIYLASVNVKAGTPASSPVIPVQTPSNISIGYINLSAGQAALINGNVNQIVDAGYQVSALMLGDKNSFIRFNQTLGVLQFSNDGVRYQGFGSGGGGGGGGSDWQDVDGAAPIRQIELGDKTLSFSMGQFQAASLFLKVPTSYLPGSPIKMKLNHFSPSASGYFRFQATATLIRKDQDAFGSTTNQYLSTNGDMANAVANQNREVLYDLSSPAGAINGVSPNAGDLILIQVQRITPTGSPEDASDVRMIPGSTEISFS